MSGIDTLVHNLRMIAGDDGDWVAGPISANVLREAADTIESLRTMLQETQTEANHWKVEQVHAYGNWEDACKRVRELEANDGTRWHDLFGTPERALLTIASWCTHSDGSCVGCPVYGSDVDDCSDCDALLEWLRSKEHE